MLNKNGLFSFIMPTSILNDKSNSKLRKFLLARFSSIFINQFPEKSRVFENVTQDVAIYIFSNKDNQIKLRKNLDEKSIMQKEFFIIPKKIIEKLNYKVPLLANDVE
ncbi:MAG: hypothetical protein N3A69_12735, partial [Leptospiraceae bacterium]|nr:hypothetical protein [Leptospiraceae bacterium]